MKRKTHPRRKQQVFSAAVAALVLLSQGIAVAQQDEPKIQPAVDGHSSKFDVFVDRIPTDQSKSAQPIAVSIYFADGSAQKVDISKYGFVVIDVSGRQIKLHSSNPQPKTSQAPAPTDVKTKPVRVPLPKDFDPGKNSVRKKSATPKKKSPNKMTLKKVGAPAKAMDSTNDRLDRLEAMLRDLQKQMKSLHAELRQQP